MVPSDVVIDASQCPLLTVEEAAGSCGSVARSPISSPPNTWRLAGLPGCR